jgi:hypothetical protein
MAAAEAFALLTEACRALEELGEHAAAAYIGHALLTLERRHPELGGAADDPDA